MKIFVRNFDPGVNPSSGFFASIRKRTNNLKKYFDISSNNERAIVYEGLIGIYNGSSYYQGFIPAEKGENTNLTFTFKRHLMQISHIIVGEPEGLCFSYEFQLKGKDENNKEIDLGSYSNVEHNFCTSEKTSYDMYCKNNGTVTFKIIKGNQHLLKSITYISTDGSCNNGNHLAIKGIDLFGNLFDINQKLTCHKAHHLNNLILIMITIII